MSARASSVLAAHLERHGVGIDLEDTRRHRRVQVFA
jgi:hypothetical protein